MNCTLCNASIPDGTSTCSCCGASCEAPSTSREADDALDQCLPVGSSLLGGHYRIGRLLGHGGFGVTYQGSDIPMQLPVAIKEFFPSGCFRHGLILQPGRKNSSQEFAEQRGRFLEEARVLGRLNHAGIVRVYTAFEENSTAYMVMELVRGKTLEALIKERGRLGEEEVLEYFHKLVDALEVMHGHGDEGLLHRDIKPSNIMVTSQGRVVLIDFGTARQFAANVSHAMSQVLTPGYAPLEQYSARGRFGPPLDIYALGATLYHALTGQPPPDAVERSQGVELKPPQTACPTVSRPTSDAVVAALEVSACRRPQSVAELKRMFGGETSPLSVPGASHATSQPPLTPNSVARVQVIQPPEIISQLGGDYLNAQDGTALMSVAGGTFQMGSNGPDAEKPIHPVTLKPYLLARVPVTNAQFARFVWATGYDAGSDWRRYASEWGDQAPVVCVNWNDVSAYCTWAGLRLPTEEEWEYAARGPQSLIYPWGNSWDPSCCQHSVGSSNNSGHATPVGRFPSGASPFGCLDMAGNVWEWTDSWYNRYPGSAHKDDDFGRTCRVLRGGSWFSSTPSTFRGANRYRSFPRYRYNYCGFRCARSL